MKIVFLTRLFAGLVDVKRRDGLQAGNEEDLGTM